MCLQAPLTCLGAVEVREGLRVRKGLRKSEMEKEREREVNVLLCSVYAFSVCQRNAPHLVKMLSAHIKKLTDNKQTHILHTHIQKQTNMLIFSMHL